MGEYEVYLLGNNLSLAKCELTSLVQRITDCAEFQWNGRVGTVKSDVNPLPLLRERAVLTHEVGRVLADGTKISEIAQNLTKPIFETNDSGMTFAVKVIDVDSALQSGEKTSLASKIGSCIQNLTRRPVSLKRPQEVYTLFVMEERWFLSKSYSISLCKRLQKVRARQYPFFHPSMMNSVLARVMCNIAGILPSDIVLDPFCGGGGILVEAEKIGARVIGIDRNWRLLSGAKSNLLSVKVHNHTLVQSDSRYLPIDDVDRIVTDPPYGKSSSTLGARSTELVETCIRRVLNWERLQGMCICADSKMDLGRFLQDVGLEVHTRVPIRVHRSLTREVFRVQF